MMQLNPLELDFVAFPSQHDKQFRVWIHSLQSKKLDIWVKDKTSNAFYMCHIDNVENCKIGDTPIQTEKIIPVLAAALARLSSPEADNNGLDANVDAELLANGSIALKMTINFGADITGWTSEYLFALRPVTLLSQVSPHYTPEEFKLVAFDNPLNAIPLLLKCTEVGHIEVMGVDGRHTGGELPQCPGLRFHGLNKQLLYIRIKEQGQVVIMKGALYRILLAVELPATSDNKQFKMTLLMKDQHNAPNGRLKVLAVCESLPVPSVSGATRKTTLLLDHVMLKFGNALLLKTEVQETGTAAAAQKFALTMTTLVAAASVIGMLWSRSLR